MKLAPRKKSTPLVASSPPTKLAPIGGAAEEHCEVPKSSPSCPAPVQSPGLTYAEIVAIIKNYIQSTSPMSEHYVFTSGSLTGGGNITTDPTLHLINDVDSPGSNYYYGTDSTPAKG